MELNVLEESSNRIVAEVKGATHTLCNPIKAELWKNKSVKLATYSISHPLVGVPKFIVETDETLNPRDAMAEAASSLIKSMENLKKEFKKIK